MDEQGEVTKRVSGTLSEEGCFDSLELLDLENNTVVARYWTPIITVMPRHWRKEFVCRKMPASRITFCRGELGNR